MFHSDIKILDGAFVISDAHFCHSRPELLEFMKDIDSKRYSPSQLLLFGDIFDALFGSISYTIEENKEMILLLESISKKIDVIYLEGNHDFNLKKVFSNMKIFTISEQPVLCEYKDKKCLIAHGDFAGNLGYKIYTFLIRNRFLLLVLNFINNTFSNVILNTLDKYLSKKDDCKEFTGFKKYIAHKLERYDFKCDYFIEGHLHQNKSVKFDDFTYINLPAFACNQRYFIVEFSKDKMVLEENIYSKEK